VPRLNTTTKSLGRRDVPGFEQVERKSKIKDKKSKLQVKKQKFSLSLSRHCEARQCRSNLVVGQEIATHLSGARNDKG